MAAARFQRNGAGAAAGRVAGIARLAAQAPSATRMISAATVNSPWPVAISMPAIVPSRIAKKVPASTSALPSSSSSGAKRSGRIAYLIGPKKAASTPIANSSASRSAALPVTIPTAAATITAISISLMTRASHALSLPSAKAPALAEHRKNGRMKSPPASGINSPADHASPTSAR